MDKTLLFDIVIPYNLYEMNYNLKDKDDIFDNFLLNKLLDFVDDNQGKNISIDELIVGTCKIVEDNIFKDLKNCENYFISYTSKILNNYNNYHNKEENDTLQDVLFKDTYMRLKDILWRTPVFYFYINEYCSLKDIDIPQNNLDIPIDINVDITKALFNTLRAEYQDIFTIQPEEVFSKLKDINSLDTYDYKDYFIKEVNNILDAVNEITMNKKHKNISTNDFKNLFFYRPEINYGESSKMFLKEFDNIFPFVTLYSKEKNAFDSCKDCIINSYKKLAAITLNEVLQENKDFRKNDDIVFSEDFSNIFKSKAQENINNYFNLINKDIKSLDKSKDIISNKCKDSFER